ncbi:LPXTG cell wall anchor domain-containing protein [Streptomyces griseus]|uniref:LPXTG cell wall anchor domain-containing protein n=1 Tax=Streptomyces griseus TaxID=1911 RepID=UPI0008407C7C|nr:LPXTG cell wall anchor domain-containing protein [Streptomyces griseus]
MPPKPPARLRDGRALTRLGLAAGLAVPAGLLGSPAAIAIPVTAPVAQYGAVAGPQPACGDPDGADFPIDTRIHGGPDTYASGGGYGTWYLDLINTTSEPCHSIHPVLVLTDEDRTLTPEQIQLEFTERTHPDEEHRVTWESTDRDEQIGVFGSGEHGDDFPGFTVPAKRTVTVEIRMAFTSDTRPGRVTANAAIVQRRPTQDGGKQDAGKRDAGQADGDWVGESAGYDFVIVEGAADGGTGTDPEEAGVPRDAAGDPLPELARTGRPDAAWAALTAGALILGGAALVLRFRRRT